MSATTTLAVCACVAGAGVVGYGLLAATSGLFAPVVSRGRRESRAVALTFDDGPWPGSTDVILDTLKAAGVRAAFFVIGRHVKLHPGLVKRMHEEGHIVGNHSFDHHRFGIWRGVEYWRAQIGLADDAIRDCTGAMPLLFRPPMGFKSPMLARAAKGKTIVAWSRRCFDGVAVSHERIVRRAANTGGGDILLLHDGRDPASRRDVGATAAALPRILESIKERGLEVARLDDLIGRLPY